MPTTYKDKISAELSMIPEDMLPKFYRIFHALVHEMFSANNEQAKIVTKPQSLYGIWSNSEIDDTIMRSARNSLFSYEKKGDLP